MQLVHTCLSKLPLNLLVVLICDYGKLRNLLRYPLPTRAKHGKDVPGQCIGNPDIEEMIPELSRWILLGRMMPQFGGATDYSYFVVPKFRNSCKTREQYTGQGGRVL